MGMSKKDFIELADCLQRNKPVGSHEGQSAFGEGFEKGRLAHWNRMVEVLAEFCAGQNPRFNRERWLGYINRECGSNGGKPKCP